MDVPGVEVSVGDLGTCRVQALECLLDGLNYPVEDPTAAVGEVVRHLRLKDDYWIYFLRPIEDPVPSQSRVRGFEVGSVEMEPGRKAAELMVSGHAEMIVQRAARHPLEKHTPATTRHSPPGGVDEAPTVTGRNEAADVEVGLGGKSIEPCKLVLYIGV